ncbi:YdcF family protein [Macrococcoides canis]|uniref:YdcF family protein n=1 Tax=Macrococcoides canis TaxID=1855823 RepID=UPI0013E9148F|nr:YdcF family protein [Macrococcus canis]QIH75186.1 YdcF family protein [Macrococcus canis]
MYSDEVLYHAKKLYDFHNVNKKTKYADFILVMGSHDDRAAYKASELFKQKKGKFIICSGGLGKITKSLWHISEAEKFADICIKQGVPKKCVLIENESTNSGENFKFSKALLETKGYSVTTGLIVCKNYLSRRALATANKQWSEVEWYIETPNLKFENYPNELVPLDKMINLMVGDIQRLILYYELGFQTHVEIPLTIYKSYEYLIKNGFTKYLIKEN